MNLNRTTAVAEFKVHLSVNVASNQLFRGQFPRLTNPVALEETTKRFSIPEETRRASNEPFSVALLPLDADKLATGIPRAPFRPNKIKSLGEEEIFKENSRLVCSAGTSKRASRELIISRGL